jgi:3-methyl-2-oxobutanoate hydroxymethyltransferase
MSRDQVNLTRLRKKKEQGEKIVMLTAFDFPITRLMEKAGVDILLVGDSLGMTFQGEMTTIPVTLDQMIYHTRIVARAAERVLVVSDMPFLSYQASDEEAIRNAGRLLKQGQAEAVKLEGGVARAETVRKIVGCGIPVMGHIGFNPQSVHQYGNQVVQGRDASSVSKMKEDVKALEEAGVFSIVIEAVRWDVARELTEMAQVPTIGIGAGPYCDGQVLVTADLLGLFEGQSPKFAKRYVNLSEEILEAVEAYVKDVRAGEFPDMDHSYGPKPEA